MLVALLMLVVATASLGRVAAAPLEKNQRAVHKTVSTLVVPNCKTTMQLALPFSPNVHCSPGAACRLKETSGNAAGLMGQWGEDIARDGSVAARAARFMAIIPPGDGRSATRTFQVLPEAPATCSQEDNRENAFRFQSSDDATLTLFEGDRPVLAYNHAAITGQEVPVTDCRRKRAAYVHPIWGLDGQIITGDFPRDHYHHHGLFWAWPHVSINGKDYDLWTGQNISHKFVHWMGRETGPVAAVLGVENGWFVNSRKVMIERVWLRVFRAEADSQAIDISITWIPVDCDVSLLGAAGKSYGGLSLRYDIGPQSRPVITSPAGLEKHDLMVARLPWADMTASYAMKTADRKPADSEETVRGGAAIFVYPNHPDYPPTWLARHYGMLCVGWPGVVSKTFPAGKRFSLSYRVRVHRGDVDAKHLAAVYNDFVAGQMKSILQQSNMDPTDEHQ